MKLPVSKLMEIHMPRATLNRLTHDKANRQFFCVYTNEPLKEGRVRTSSALIFRSVQLIIITYHMRGTCKVGVMLVPLQSSEVMCGSIFFFGKMCNFH